MHTHGSTSELVETLEETKRTLNHRLRRNKRAPFERRDERPKKPREVYPPILDITHFPFFLNFLEFYDPVANPKDEPMWAADRVVVPTPSLQLPMILQLEEIIYASVRVMCSCWENPQISPRSQSNRANGKNWLIKSFQTSSQDTWSRDDNTVSCPHGFIFGISHGIIEFEKVKKEWEVGDIEDRGRLIEIMDNVLGKTLNFAKSAVYL
nr:hypothetical protein [Tanacetum cinerariifolium]